MGLLDGLLGNLMGSYLGGNQERTFGSGNQMQGGNMLLQLALTMLQQNGGLEGVLGKFRQGGLAQQADSWGRHRTKYGSFRRSASTGLRSVHHGRSRIQARDANGTDRLGDGAVITGVDQPTYAPRASYRK